MTTVVADGLSTEGDPQLTRLVLYNLLANAWKFSSKQPAAMIEFSRTDGDGQPVFRVQDNGAGFDMRYAHKLFTTFQRLHAAADFEGTGIGLAIVQRVVQRHRGWVKAEAAPGQGATFSFTLGPPPTPDREHTS